MSAPPVPVRRAHRALPGGPHRAPGWTPPPPRRPEHADALLIVGRAIAGTAVADEALVSAVVRARSAGATWEELGAVFGLRAKTVWTRYATACREAL